MEVTYTEGLTHALALRDAESRPEVPDYDVRYWVTRDGRAMLVAEMEDGHLINTIRFIERNEEAYRLRMLLALTNIPEWMEPRGDMAQDAFDAEVDRLAGAGEEGDLEDLFLQYRWLREEAAERGLLEYTAPEDR